MSHDRNGRKVGRSRFSAFLALAMVSTTVAVGSADLQAQEIAAADAVTFTFENLQPADGFFFTEPWVGLHSEDFDLYNVGELSLIHI